MGKVRRLDHDALPEDVRSSFERELWAMVGRAFPIVVGVLLALLVPAADAGGRSPAVRSTSLVDAGATTHRAASRIGLAAAGYGDCGLFSTDYERWQAGVGEQFAEVVDILPVGAETRIAGAGWYGLMVMAVDDQARLDRTYGDDGIGAIPVPGTGSPDGGDGDVTLDAAAAAVAADGAVTVVAQTRPLAGGSDLVVGRFTPGGDPDPGFGAQGLVAVDLDVDDLPVDVVVGPTGTAYVLLTAQGADTSRASVVALGAGGQRLADFGVDGVVAYAPTEQESAVALSMDAAGRLLLLVATHQGYDQVGSSVVRLLSDGQLDPAFGDAGRSELGPLGYRADSDRGLLTVGDDAAVAVARVEGEVPRPRGLLRLDAHGELDAGFGDGGFAPFRFEGADGWGARLVASDDRILVATTVLVPQQRDGVEYEAQAPAVAAHGPDGDLDPTFGEGGVSTVASPDGFVLAGIAVDDLGRVHVGGPAVNHDYGPYNDIVVARLLPDGTLDGACVPGTRTVRRLAGTDRYSTAAAITAERFSASPIVYVATGTTFPDALAAGPVAAADGAPLLLVAPDSVPAATDAELRRLRPETIVIVGGEQAVSRAVEAQLATYAEVRRVAGAGRIETAAMLSASRFAPGIDTVFIATGENFPDALAVGPVAGRDGSPILLTTARGLPEATRAELARLSPEFVTIVGGSAAVSEEQEQQLAAYARSYVIRAAGPDRYATAAYVANFFYEPFGAFGEHGATPEVFVATGANFPDALAAGPAAAAVAAPIVLTTPTALREVSRDALARSNPVAMIVVGGQAAVADEVADVLLTPEIDYTFLDYAGDETPTSFDPCSPVHWVFNPSGAPPGGLELVTEAVARLEAASGVDWVYDGTSDEPVHEDREPYQPDRYGHRYAPVLVGWSPLGGGIDGLQIRLGEGGFTAVDGIAVSGVLQLNADLVNGAEEPSRDFATGVSWGSVILHELSHVLGLDHIGLVTELMYPFTTEQSTAAFGPGDLLGLHRLYVGAGCNPPPPPGATTTLW